MSNQLVVDEKRFGNETQPGMNGGGLPWPEGCDPHQEAPRVDPAELFPTLSRINSCDSPRPQLLTGNGRGAVSDSRTPVITQQELEECRQLARTRQAYEAIRKRIIAKIDQGAVIEPGSLNARIEEKSARVFSRPKVEAVIGKCETQRIYSEIEPTVRRCLRVT